MRRTVLLALLASRCANAASPIHAAPPKPEAVIGSLLSATRADGTRGHALPRALLAQLFANAIKLSDLSGAANGTVLGGRREEPVFTPTATAADARGTISLAAAAQPAGPVASPGGEKVWLCKRPVYPVALLTQYGIPVDVAEEVNARGYHAYVLHGTSPHTSLAYQFTSTNGWELWNKVLGILKEKGSGGMEQLAKEDIAEWGKTMAAEIGGPAETSSAPGLKIFTTATQCWGSELGSRCTQQQMDEATKAYAARRPEFNLLSNNCARFACAMLAACGGAEPVDEARLALIANSSADAAAAADADADADADASGKATCRPDACADNLMFEGPRGQPGCGMKPVSTKLEYAGALLGTPSVPVHADAAAAAAASAASAAGAGALSGGVGQQPQQLGAAQGVQGMWKPPQLGMQQNMWGAHALYPAAMMQGGW